MINVDIARLLLEYKQMRKDAQGLRAEMLKIVVEELGVSKSEAQRTNLETFLDGYLLGQESGKSCRKTTNHEISALLRQYHEVKRCARNLRVEMLRVAVEDLGMEQNEALQANLEVFLDGYLVGQGMIPSRQKYEATLHSDSIRSRRILAASSDSYRANLSG